MIFEDRSNMIETDKAEVATPPTQYREDNSIKTLDIDDITSVQNFFGDDTKREIIYKKE